MNGKRSPESEAEDHVDMMIGIFHHKYVYDIQYDGKYDGKYDGSESIVYTIQNILEYTMYIHVCRLAHGPKQSLVSAPNSKLRPQRQILKS